MKALLIYRWIHHERTMQQLARMLTDKGYPTDVICLNNLEYTNNTGGWIVEKLLKLVPIIRQCGIRIVRRFTPQLADYILKCLILRMYDKVQFNAFYKDYLPWMKNCVKHNVKYDIMLWGSDVLRSSNENFKVLRWGFEHAQSICGPDVLLDKVSEKYGDILKLKYVEVDFGDNNFDLINEVEVSEEKKLKLFGDESKDKLIIVCGYNARDSQQHILMLKAIKNLPLKYKQRIHIVIPLTYERGNVDYLKSVYEYLTTIGVTYKTLDSFLDITGLCALRKYPDIVMNAQISDAISSALLEHLYCGCVTLIADWLNYPLYDKLKVWYVKYNKDTIAEKLEDVISNYNEYKTYTKANKGKLYKHYSWEGMMDRWEYAIKS